MPNGEQSRILNPRPLHDFPFTFQRRPGLSSRAGAFFFELEKHPLLFMIQKEVQQMFGTVIENFLRRDESQIAMNKALVELIDLLRVYVFSQGEATEDERVSLKNQFEKITTMAQNLIAQQESRYDIIAAQVIEFKRDLESLPEESA